MVANQREGFAIVRDNPSGNTTMKSTTGNASDPRTRELIACGDACIGVTAEGAGSLGILRSPSPGIVSHLERNTQLAA
jgi:hypothetical protein